MVLPMTKLLLLTITSLFFLSCAGSKGSTGYPLCDEAKLTQKTLMLMHQASLSDPSLGGEFRMEKKRYDSQVLDCQAESKEKGIIQTSGQLLCGNDLICMERMK